MSKKDEIIQSTQETLEGSSIHAIPNITRNKFVTIKLLWLFCFLGSFGVCAWFIYQSVLDYLNYDVVTKFDIKYEDSLTFPIVTICNLNYFSTPFAFTFSNRLFNKTNPRSDETITAKMVSNYYIKTKQSGSKMIGYDIDQIILSCEFSSQQCNLTNDFDEYLDPWYGRCYRYNSGTNMLGQQVKKKSVYQSGTLAALDLELFIGSAASNDRPFSVENGLNIFIQNEQLDSIMNEGIRISPGTSTTIALKKYQIGRKPKPYSNCTADLTSIDSYDSVFYKKVFSPNSTYSYTKCNFVCIQKLIGNECKCQASLYENTYYPNMRLCSIPGSNLTNLDLLRDQMCLSGIANKYFNTPSEERDCDCPLECVSNGYDHIISTAEFPTFNFYQNFLEKNMVIKSKLSTVNFDQVKQSVARLQIYFNEMKQTYIEENEKLSMSDLISGIGGTLGLFLGNFIYLNKYTTEK